MRRFNPLTGCLVVLLGFSPLSHSATATWVAGVGNWTGSNLFWSPGVLPLAGDDIVINNPALFQQLTVFNNSPSINSLFIGTNNNPIAPDEFHIANGRSVTIATGGLTNNGIVSLNAIGATTSLLFQGSQTITGTGTINLSNSVNNRLRSSGIDDILTIGSSITVKGAGTLVDNFGGMINNGTIIADQAIQLIIDTDVEGFTQAGSLSATGTGGLFIRNTPTFTNTNGIDIGAGSNLDVRASRIVGGTINIDPTASATFRVATDLEDVTINGTVTHNNGETVDIFNALTLNGDWNINGDTATTSLLFHDSQTLTSGATGTINLSNSVNNQLRSSGFDDTLTIGSNITVKGAGTLVANFGGMTNNGTIIADQAIQLIIDTDVEGFTQAGSLSATGTGGLFIRDTPTFTNTNGIDIGAGSNLDVRASRIVGGAINIDPTASATFRVGTDLEDVTINGTVTHNNGDTVDIFNALTLNGDWNINGDNATTSLLFHGNQTLTSDTTGTINLSNSANNQLRSSGIDDILTIGSNITVKGAGTLVANFGGMTNNGTIIADQAIQLIIDTDVEGFTQAGSLSATGTGGLFIRDTPTFTNTNGIDIGAGSNLDVRASRIVGGAINIDPTASATFRVGTDLEDVTINGTVTHNNGDTVDIFNALTLNGDWNINGDNATTSLLFHGNQTLTSDTTGTINLSNSANNQLRNSGINDILTIGNDVTVKGAGTLVANFGGLINNGTIRADQTTRLIIDTDTEGFENRGNVRVLGTGGLRSVGDFLQTAGTTTVDSTLEFTASGALLLHGGLLEGSGLITGDVLNTGGTVNTGNSPGTLTINGDYEQTLGGTLLIEISGTANGQFDVLQVNGDATLGGTIEVALLGSPGFAVGQTFDVLFANNIFDSFANSTVSAGSANFDVSIISGATDFVRLTATSAVPLPPAIWLFLSTTCALLIRSRRAAPGSA